MPIIDLDPPRLDQPITTPKDFAVTPGAVDLDHGSDAPVERPAWSSTFGAAFRQDNTVGAYFSREPIDTADEAGFNPWDAIKGSKYEEHWPSFADVHNSRAADARKRQIDRELDDQRTLAAAPWYKSVPAELLAGGLDLPSLIPGGAFVRGASGGISVARSALNVGLAAGVSSLAQETALHGLQETRSTGESAFNVGASVFLGGLLGAGGAKLLSHGEWTKAVAALDHDLARAEPAVPGDEARALPEGGAGAPASAGAAVAEPTSLEANSIAGKMAGATAAATSRLNPVMRALQSPSPVYRDVFNQAFENTVYLKKNMEGVASEPAAETFAKQWNAGLGKAVQTTNDAWSDYRKAGGALGRDEFRQAVGQAMRRGDEADDPFVTKVAKEWRAKVFDPLKNAAIDTGQLPADVSVETAASYFSRMWNRNKLIAQEGKFKDTVRSWVADSAPQWAKQFDAATERRLTPLQREIDDLEMSKLRRGEEAKQRANGGEVDPGDMPEDYIRQAMRIVQGGAPKPKGVQTLTQFVRDAGGLVEFAGELRSMGISNTSLPGMIRKEARKIGADNKVNGGGWRIDDMTRHAWENGYFPEHTERPDANVFLEALSDDFNKRRAVVREGDRDAYRLTEMVNALEQDLSRIGATETKGARFSTSEELKGMVGRVHKALDAEADAKITKLRGTLAERQAAANVERDARFIGDPHELGHSIANEVFDTLTGKTTDSVRPEFITVKARGPLKERTFNIPDHLVEDFLEHDVERVGSRYSRVMGADVELARKFGSPDMVEQIQKIREDYARLRSGVTDEKKLMALGDREKADIRDLEALRDQLRGTRQESPIERNYARLVRATNQFNYIRSLGEVVISSLTDAIRPAMVHGLAPYMGGVAQLFGNMKGIKLSVEEAKLAGNVTEQVLGHRLATIAEITDPYSSRGPVEAFLENMTNVASKWNGIRIWTDAMKSISSVMTQNRILQGIEKYGTTKKSERAYLAFLGVDQSMAERIAEQFAEHGEKVGGVRVANTEGWTDDVARRTYRAAMNKDVDSIIVQKSVADVPLFAATPTGKALLQFKSFTLASHQRILLRGLQEDQARFIGGVVAMTAMGMFMTWMKAVTGNRVEKLQDITKNPGWWIGEGLDRSGIFGVPIEIANAFEKMSGFNPIKAPLKLGDQGSAMSQKNQNRNELGSALGPSFGLVQDAGSVLGIPSTMAKGEDVKHGQISAAVRLMPFNSYYGVRSMMNYLVHPPQ